MVACYSFVGYALAFLRKISGLIHRDMAARNLLLVKRDAEGLVPQVKVTDFGLTRSGPTYKMSAPEEFPFIICAPESLADDAIWTYRSEVWSFGVLIWEVLIVALCEFELKCRHFSFTTMQKVNPTHSKQPTWTATRSVSF